MMLAEEETTRKKAGNACAQPAYANSVGNTATSVTNRIGRGERIRTSDSCVPNAVLYQAELRPVGLANFIMLRCRLDLHLQAFA